MKDENLKDPLNGVTLKKIVNDLVKFYGFGYLARETKIACFIYDPSLTSSLKFLRRNIGPRKKVEQLYIKYLKEYQDGL